jgi:hypothetical protein
VYGKADIGKHRARDPLLGRPQIGHVLFDREDDVFACARVDEPPAW